MNAAEKAPAGGWYPAGRPENLRTMTTLPSGQPPVNGGSCTSTHAKLRIRPIVHAPQRQPRKFVMPGRIVFGHFNLIAGDGGTLKSHLVAAVAAAVMGGCRLPGQAKAKDAGNALILSAEQDQFLDLRPQIEAAGGDPSRVYAFDDGDDDLTDGFDWKAFLDALPDMITTHNLRFVGIDPLTSFLTHGTRSDNMDAIRWALQPLQRIAMRTGACILGTAHVVDSLARRGIIKALGSVHFRNVPRYVCGVAPLPERPGVFALRVIKHQFDAGSPDLLYRHAGQGGGDRIEWLGEEELDDDALGDIAADPGAAMEADQALQIVLGHWSDDPVDFREILRDARAIDVKPTTLRRRMRKLGVVTKAKGQVGKQTFLCYYPPRPEKK